MTPDRPEAPSDSPDPEAERTGPAGPPGPSACSCREAQAWRAYWTREAIELRLAHEVALYRDVVTDALWRGGSTSPVAPRVSSAFSNIEVPWSFAALEKRRNGA